MTDDDLAEHDSAAKTYAQWAAERPALAWLPLVAVSNGETGNSMATIDRLAVAQQTADEALSLARANAQAIVLDRRADEGRDRLVERCLDAKVLAVIAFAGSALALGVSVVGLFL